MEILHNGFIKIEPIEFKSYLPSEQVTYNEIGTVIDFDQAINPVAYAYRGEVFRNDKISKGDKVKFDRFLAYKFPREGEVDKWDWYVKYQDIISSEPAAPIPEK